ncbi:protein of unknown function [Azospirillum baldaniorum]|uniref:Uncharacterized protein n=1 Tax=Azospirillum baldaniorum TaxID=1064539 RepID=A0A9P1NMM1_9PROT|nr:protein of unknown function [Azospirillum baldaniorum]
MAVILTKSVTRTSVASITPTIWSICASALRCNQIVQRLCEGASICRWAPLLHFRLYGDANPFPPLALLPLHFFPSACELLVSLRDRSGFGRSIRGWLDPMSSRAMEG